MYLADTAIMDSASQANSATFVSQVEKLYSQDIIDYEKLNNCLKHLCFPPCQIT